ncbi:heme peroxidase [Cristinia sonorae]|uniref:Peroxidase n=1 Tax=Cristinia sonorae TaxID=1940300 RepID=A0A8K0XQL7_9AGAR|nr:heme peroxidase [Cristinia sonorae]
MVNNPASWKTFIGRVCFATILSSASVGNAYIWPNPMLEELDSQLYDRQGYNARGLPGGMRPDCNVFFFNNVPGTGRANVGDWVRTAYHDMATHNTADGTGGLDASIRFEQQRQENAGDGFQNTLLFIQGLSNRYFSLADNIALAAVTAIEMCGGPKINFRGGRIDATTANTPGVPEPQQSLTEHIASFARQGFTQSEMISLIACGHTFGGVQHIAFPDISPASVDPENTSGNSRFDTTFTYFDNNIVTEYLDGTTASPLIVGDNIATRSDFRIFSSDSNVTMTGLTDPSVFRSTCANLYARMIDTVPSSVTLTEVIQPLRVKPVAVQLIWIGGGNIKLQGEVRFWDSSPSQIKLVWKARDGSSNSAFSATLTDPSLTTNPLVPDSPSLVSHWYEFLAVIIDAIHSISTFWFEVSHGDGSMTVEDQGGVGFQLQDVVMLASSTCSTSSGQVSLDFVIRADIEPSRVYVRSDAFDDTQSPITTTIDIPPPTVLPTVVSGYRAWSAVVSLNGRQWTLAVDVGLQTFETTYVAPLTSFHLNTANLFPCS